MSHSMLSTKRKFHRLLDSLTPGGPSLASNGTDPEPSANGAHRAFDSSARPAKRVRSAVKQRSELVSSSPYLTSLLNEQAARSKTSSLNSARLRADNMASSYARQQQNAEVIRLPVPTWNTSDKRAFQERLATFNVIENWFNKPLDIHAMVFAKWGWTLVGRETVRCITCHSQWVVFAGDSPFSDEDHQENEDEEEDGDDEYTVSLRLRGVQNPVYIEKTKARIETEHDSGCPWRQFQHCPDSILSISMWPPNSGFHALRERYAEVLKYSAILPRTLRLPEELEHGDDGLDRVWRAFSTGISPSSGSESTDAVSESIASPVLPAEKPIDVRHRALAIALLGWGLEPQPARRPEHEACLKCSKCYARVGLWYFTGLDGRAPMYEYFDLVDKHEGWCPWINAATQNAGLLSTDSEPKTAWEIIRSLIISQELREPAQAVGAEPVIATGTAQGANGWRAPGAANLDSSISDETSGNTTLVQDPASPSLNRQQQLNAEPPVVHVPTGAPKLTDEERRKKHKLGMSWLSKIKGSIKSNKKADKAAKDNTQTPVTSGGSVLGDS